MATKMPAACLFASAPIRTWVYNVKSTLSYTMVTWVKVFRIIPEFRIAENAELSNNNGFFDLCSSYIKTIYHLNKKLLIFSGHIACFKF